MSNFHCGPLKPPLPIDSSIPMDFQEMESKTEKSRAILAKVPPMDHYMANCDGYLLRDVWPPIYAYLCLNNFASLSSFYLLTIIYRTYQGRKHSRICMSCFSPQTSLMMTSQEQCEFSKASVAWNLKLSSAVAWYGKLGMDQKAFQARSSRDKHKLRSLLGRAFKVSLRDNLILSRWFMMLRKVLLVSLLHSKRG